VLAVRRGFEFGVGLGHQRFNEVGGRQMPGRNIRAISSLRRNLLVHSATRSVVGTCLTNRLNSSACKDRYKDRSLGPIDPWAMRVFSSDFVSTKGCNICRYLSKACIVSAHDGTEVQ